MRWIVLISIALLTVSPAMAGPRVVTSIMPVHSIVAAVMGATGAPELLLPGRLSEHTASFTAAQISDLGKADLVFIIGHGLEAKLAQLSGSETVGGRMFVELSEAVGVKTLPVRKGGGWELDQHEDHAEGILAFDPHVWLDPENAKAMAAAVAASLATAGPANAAVYADNARVFASAIDAASAEIAADLAGVKARPFIVFHDAFQYFEQRFALNGVGSISDVSAAAPSARRLKEIRDTLTATRAVCVFREPQFDSKFVATVIEGSNARSATLDPLGSELPPGPGAYPRLLRDLAAALKSCLAG